MAIQLKSVLVGSLLLGAVTWAEPSQADSRGVTGVTREGPDIRRPPSTPPGQSWRYGYPFPFQIASRKAAAFVSLRIRNGVLSPVAGDLKIGVDVFLFDKISNLGDPQVIQISRNHEQANPHSTPPGQAAVMVKHIARCGFVPRGAKRPDGSPHPHAGSGFALSVAVAWRPSTTTKPAYGLSPFRGKEEYLQLEVHQLAYDGQTFRVVTALLHNSGRVTDRSQSCLNAIEFALTQACPGLTYDSVPHI